MSETQGAEGLPQTQPVTEPEFPVDGGGNQDLLIEHAQEVETTDPREAQNGGGVGDNDPPCANNG